MRYFQNYQSYYQFLTRFGMTLFSFVRERSFLVQVNLGLLAQLPLHPLYQQDARPLSSQLAFDRFFVIIIISSSNDHTKVRLIVHIRSRPFVLLSNLNVIL